MTPMSGKVIIRYELVEKVNNIFLSTSKKVISDIVTVVNGGSTPAKEGEKYISPAGSYLMLSDLGYDNLAIADYDKFQAKL